MKKLSLPRALVVFGAPLSFIIIGVIHPLELHVGDSAGLYIGIHIVQLFSIWGMALMLGIITEGIENRAARVARAAVLPYAITYAAFDALAGIAIGLVVYQAAGMSIADQAAIESVINGSNMDAVSPALWLGSGLTWLIASGAAILALRGRAPTGALALMMVGAAIFAVGHPFPPGPVGMTLFLGGLAWLQFGPVASNRIARSKRLPAVQPQGAHS